jgi:hypothetical protein
VTASTAKPFCERCTLRQIYRVPATQVVEWEHTPLSLCDSCAQDAVTASGVVFYRAGVGADGWPVFVMVKDGKLVLDPRDRR